MLTLRRKLLFSTSVHALIGTASQLHKPTGARLPRALSYCRLKALSHDMHCAVQHARVRVLAGMTETNAQWFQRHRRCRNYRAHWGQHGHPVWRSTLAISTGPMLNEQLLLQASVGRVECKNSVAHERIWRAPWFKRMV